MMFLSQAAEVGQVPPDDSWLTQPVATIIAALGVILAALVTFRSQEKTRTDQNEQHKALLAEARRDREMQQIHNDAALEAQREEWQARLRHEGRRERAARLGTLYSLLIQRMYDYEVAASLHQIANQGEPAEDIIKHRRHLAVESLTENSAGHSLFGLMAQCNIFGDGQVRKDVLAWHRLALRGHAVPVVTAQRARVEKSMAAHVTRLEQDLDEE